MSAKTILVAHRLGSIRDRFAAALADAHHAFIAADSAAAAAAAIASRKPAVSLAIVDLGLSDDGVELVRDLCAAAGSPPPMLVFSGSIRSIDQVRSLAALGVAGYINEHAATPQILPALAPHLFPDSFNRRASLRVPLGVPVSYRAGETIAGAVTLEVGKGGLAIRTMNPLAPGAVIAVKFRLPGVSGEIHAEGHVAWSDRKKGMGVRFDRITTAHQSMLDAFVDEHRL
jgi:uncharacterized protein (TIGR02266 family)